MWKQSPQILQNSFPFFILGKREGRTMSDSENRHICALLGVEVVDISLAENAHTVVKSLVDPGILDPLQEGEAGENG